MEVFAKPVDDGTLCYTNRFFLHGLRWMPQPARGRAGRLRAGEKLYPMPDPWNPADAGAVAVRTDAEPERYLIGYVPRYLAADITQVLLEGGCDPNLLDLRVERVDADAPLNQRILCRLRTCWPEGFEPCVGEEYQPLAQPQTA